MSVEGTKFQVNYKLPDGTLINLYAKDVKDLEVGLTDLSMVSTLIKTTSKELLGHSIASAPSVEAVAQSFNATAVISNPAPGPGNSCRHGEMAFRSGTSAKGPWKGYMCAAPKGAPDKCDTIWVR